MLGEPTSLWVVAAPFLEQQQGSDDHKEWLLQLDLENGQELKRVQVRAEVSLLGPRSSSSVRDSGALGVGR